MTTYICTAQQAREADHHAIAGLEIPSLILMEHAASKCADYIAENTAKDQKILILCGPGNNGGDGLAIARLLFLQGYDCRCLAPVYDKCSEDEKVQLQAAEHLLIPLTNNPEEALAWTNEADVIVDALFGSGLSRSIAGTYAQLIEAVNASKAIVYAVDIPSGLDGTTGQILGTAVLPDVTLALDCYKTGMFINAGRQLCQHKKVFDITIPACTHRNDHVELLDAALVRTFLPERSCWSHKGTFGKALMIGGSQSMHGAITMAAEACLHAGIGTLTLLVPEIIRPVIAGKMNQAMILSLPEDNGHFPLPDEEEFNRLIAPFSIISVGNGMQKNASTLKIVELLLKSDKPLVIDADAIWACGQLPDLLQRGQPVILSPHLKEMADLTGLSISQIKTDPLGVLEMFMQSYPNAAVVLKSDVTFVAGHGRVYVLDQPNPALAKGGSGDILCGLLCGLAASAADWTQAAAAAVYLHAAAAKSSHDSAFFQPEMIIAGLDAVLKTLRH